MRIGPYRTSTPLALAAIKRGEKLDYQLGRLERIDRYTVSTPFLVLGIIDSKNIEKLFDSPLQAEQSACLAAGRLLLCVRSSLGRLERIELSTQVPQTRVLPLNYSRHSVYVYHTFLAFPILLICSFLVPSFLCRENIFFNIKTPC